MPTRRRLLGLWPLVFVGACSARRSSPIDGSKSGVDPAGASRRLSTALGDVDLTVSEGSPTPWIMTVERSAAQVARVWGKAVRPISLTVGSDAQLAASSDDVDAETAAVTTAKGEVFVAASVDRTLSQLGRQVVVAHELVHARLAQYGSDRTALWLKEGAAEWSATPPHGAPGVIERWPNLVRAHASDPSRFTRAPSADVFTIDAKLAYEWAAAYVTYLVDVHGQDQVKELVVSRPREATADAAVARLRRRPGAKPFSVWLQDEFSG